MKNKELLEKYAKDHNLSCSLVGPESAKYNDIKVALHGFTDYSEAVQAAQELHMTVVLLASQPHSTRSVLVKEASGPIVITPKDYGDGFEFVENMEPERFMSRVNERLKSGFESLSDLAEFVEEQSYIYCRTQHLPKGDSVVVLKNGVYHSVAKKTCTVWHGDKVSNIIAVM